MPAQAHFNKSPFPTYSSPQAGAVSAISPSPALLLLLLFFSFFLLQSLLEHRSCAYALAAVEDEGREVLDEFVPVVGEENWIVSVLCCAQHETNTRLRPGD